MGECDQCLWSVVSVIRDEAFDSLQILQYKSKIIKINYWEGNAGDSRGPSVLSVQTLCQFVPWWVTLIKVKKQLLVDSKYPLGMA